MIDHDFGGGKNMMGKRVQTILNHIDKKQKINGIANHVVWPCNPAVVKTEKQQCKHGQVHSDKVGIASDDRKRLAGRGDENQIANDGRQER
jgi:hypothetical protein